MLSWGQDQPKVSPRVTAQQKESLRTEAESDVDPLMNKQ